jgi:protein phosphatase
MPCRCDPSKRSAPLTDVLPSKFALAIAAVSDAGTMRPGNEDAVGFERDAAGSALVAVADGVSGQEGGEVASKRAVETLLRAYREEPASLPAAKRLARAFQQANIEVYELATTVPELRGMATTLTAAVIERGHLTAAHVGDSRLYLLRGGEITQLTKDHTVAAEQIRLGVLRELRGHPGRSILTRSVGRELIVAIDRISMDLEQGDLLIFCSDGLYNVLDDREIGEIARDADVERACRALVDAANGRGTPDNVTAAAVRVTGSVPPRAPSGLAGAFRRLVGRG